MAGILLHRLFSALGGGNVGVTWQIQSKGLSSFGRLQNQRLGIKTPQVVTSSDLREPDLVIKPGRGVTREYPRRQVALCPRKRGGGQDASQGSAPWALCICIYIYYVPTPPAFKPKDFFVQGWSPGCNRHLASSDFNPPSTGQTSEHQSSLSKERFFQVKVTKPRSAVAFHSFQQIFKYIEGI